MPGPKKGSAASRGAALPQLGYARVPGTSERRITPTGETISKREYLALQRSAAYFDGKRVTNERFARINALVERQVARSRADHLSIAEKRALAFQAAALGVKAPSRRRGPNSAGRIFEILRDDLDIDFGDDGDEVDFWWDEHESAG